MRNPNKWTVRQSRTPFWPWIAYPPDRHPHDAGGIFHSWEEAMAHVDDYEDRISDLIYTDAWQM